MAESDKIDGEIASLYKRNVKAKKKLKVRRCEAKHMVEVLRTLADCLDDEVKNIKVESGALGGASVYHLQSRYGSRISHRSTILLRPERERGP